MPRTDLEFAQEINRWKSYLSNIENIPDDDVIIKNRNDFYERFTKHVKYWVEDEFGYFLSDQDKKLHRIGGSLQRTQESHDLSEQIGSLMAPMDANWYSAALSGNEKTKGFLPHYPEQSQDAVNQRMDAIREQVKSTFLPAYRALHESFSKRHFWQWITQHAQYTAERDALKVMKNVIKSVTNMTDSELKDALAESQRNITEEYVQEIGNERIPGIKMYQPTESKKVHELDYDYSELLRENEEMNKKDNIILQNDDPDKENEIEDELKLNEHVFFPHSHDELEPMMFFDPKYIPNVYHIDREYHLAEKWYNILREANDYLVLGRKTGIKSNSPVAKFSKELKKNPKLMPIFRKNYEFARQVWQVEDKERMEYVVLEKADHEESMKDILKDAPKYKIPAPIEGLVSLDTLDKTIKQTNKILEEKKKEEERIANITDEDIKKSFVKDTLLEEKPELKDNPELLDKLTEERYERWTVFDEIVEKNPDIKDQDVLNKMTDEELARRHAEQNKHERVDLSNEFKDDKNVEKSEVVSEPPYVNKELQQ